MKWLKHIFGKATGGAPALTTQWIQPAAESRWFSPSLRYYTPDRVEGILRGTVSGDLTAAWELFDLMQRTWPRLQKNLCELCEAVYRVDWQVHPWTQRGHPPTPEDADKAALLEDAIWSGSADPWRHELDLLDALYHLAFGWVRGFAAVEIIWEQRRIGAMQLWCPKAYLPAPPEFFRIENGELAFVDQQPGKHLKFILAVHRARPAPLVGASKLEPLAWFWAAQNFTWEWWLNYAQLFGVPIRYATYDPAAPADLIKRLEDVLRHMGSSAWAALPAGTTLQILESAKSNASNPHAAIIEATDRMCDQLVLGEHLTGDIGDKGSYAAARVHKGIRYENQVVMLEWLGRVLTTQLAGAFVQLNWGAGPPPSILPNLVAPENELALAQRDQMLLAMGLELPKAWLYERHHVPMPQPGDDTVGRHGLSIQAKESDLAAPNPWQTVYEQLLELIKSAKSKDEAIAALQHAIWELDLRTAEQIIESAMQQGLVSWHEENQR